MLRQVILILALVPITACSPRTGIESSPPTTQRVPLTDPGRFTFSVIGPTIGPADGPATQLILAETPITKDYPKTYIRIGLHGLLSDWSGKSVRLVGENLSKGWATLWSGDQSASIPVAEIRFGPVVDGQAATGEYDLTFSDGTRSQGRFQAKWRPSPMDR